MPRPVISYSQEVRETHPTQTEVKTMMNWNITCEEYYNEDNYHTAEEIAELMVEGEAEG